MSEDKVLNRIVELAQCSKRQNNILKVRTKKVLFSNCEMYKFVRGKKTQKVLSRFAARRNKVPIGRRRVSACTFATRKAYEPVSTTVEGSGITSLRAKNKISVLELELAVEMRNEHSCARLVFHHGWNLIGFQNVLMTLHNVIRRMWARSEIYISTRRKKDISSRHNVKSMGEGQ